MKNMELPCESMIIEIVKEISSNRNIRRIENPVIEYWDAYVSTNDIMHKILRLKKRGLVDKSFKHKEIRLVCDKLTKSGELFKSKKLAGCYAQYCLPLKDGWSAGLTNLYRKQNETLHHHRHT